LEPVIITNRYKPVIVVVAFNRKKSLQRLLGSLSQATYPEDVKLVISIDREQGNESIFRIATEFEWGFGQKEVIYRSENMGLRNHILACGDLTEKYGSILLLEDDLYVSPCFYEFASRAVNYYAADQRVFGVSLYSRQMNVFEGGLPFIPIEDGSDVYFCQRPGSWGQVWTAEEWRKFREWFLEQQKITEDDVLPENVRKWPDSSWLKYHAKYIVENDLFYVYPRVSVTTNFGDPGVHVARQVNAYQVQLQLKKDRYHFAQLDDSLSVYDVFFELLPDRLNRLVPKLKQYDYVVDLYGSKNLDKYSSPYVITKTQATDPVFSYGHKFRPLIMNVINKLPGNSIFLARKKDLKHDVESIFNPFIYYYSHLQPRTLVALLKTKLKWRKPFSFFFRP